MKIFLIFTIFACINSPAGAARKIHVSTSEGPVVGLKHAGHSYFQSIPYAKPPMGELRWKAPRKLERRHYVWDGRDLITRCAQIENLLSGTQDKEFGTVVGQEDCLYLNIWTPSVRPRKKKPVFFWIHGGSNFKGFGQDELYDAKNLSTAVDAVVVTFNYRMGLLGAFTHRDFTQENALDHSGNYTTLDILAALDWVRENIANFGGDKNNITVAGESAGCMNVWGILQTPLARDKFHRAYCASGLPNNYPRLVSNQVGDNLVDEAKKLRGIDTRLKGKKLKEFLYSLTAKEIVKISHALVPIQHISDGVVFPKLGLGSLAFGNLHRVPLLTGMNRNESTLFSAAPLAGLSEQEMWEIANGEISDQPLFDFINDPIKMSAFESADRSAYVGMRSAIDTSLTAAKIYLPAIYKYELFFKSEQEPWKTFFKSTHAIDLPLLFQKKEFKKKHFMRFLNSDLKTTRVKRLQNLWAAYLKNFLYTGNPNGEGLQNWPDWKVLPWKNAMMRIGQEDFTPVSDSDI